MEGLSRLENLLVIGLGVACRLLDKLLGIALLAHGSLRHVLCVTAEDNIGTAACHVGRDGHRAVLTCLGDDLGFLVVLLRVENVVRNTAALEHLREQLGFFDRNSTDKHRLTLLVRLDDLVDYRVELAALGLEYGVGKILTDNGLVGRNLDNVELVDLLELLALGLTCTCHARQLAVQTEVVLEGDCRERLALALNLYALLSLDSLVQTLVEASAVHQTACELVDDDDLAVLDNVVNVELHYAVSLDCLVDVVRNREVLGVGEVLKAEMLLSLLYAELSKGSCLLLLVDNVVDAVLLVVGFHVLLGVELGEAL